MAPPDTKTAVMVDGEEKIRIPIGDDLSAEERVKTYFWNKEVGYEGWASDILLSQLKLVSATATPQGNTVFSWTLLPEHCNRLGNAHGGCLSTVFDFCTSSALAPVAEPGFLGVSRTLNVTYFRPVPVGTEMLIESTVVHSGKRLSTIHGVMRRRRDGAVLATCEHGTVNIDPPGGKL